MVELTVHGRWRIPLWVKVVYTMFVTVLVPCYWRAYGAANFLSLCDIALLLTLVGMWLESSLLLSMQTVAILLPLILWNIDVLSRAIFGYAPLNMTAYMFDTKIPLFLRALSTFHGWLPLLLIYGLIKLGYDRRALVWQMVVGTLVFLICYFFTSSPPAPAPGTPVNVNFVFGTNGAAPQTYMHPLLWLLMLIVGMPLLIYWPTHLILSKLFPRPTANVGAA